MKKIISFLAALALVFGTGAGLPQGAGRIGTGIAASAGDVITTGNYIYSIEDGEAILYGMTSDSETVEIPETIEGYPVTQMLGNVFYKCENMKKAILPSGVTSMGNVFNLNNKLESIDTSKNSNFVFENGVLYNKDKTEVILCLVTTKSVFLPSTVKSIGEFAFLKCTLINNIDLPSSLTTIGGSAFKTCGLKSVTIPDSVTEIGDDAFGDCKNLVEVTLPKGIKTINSFTFGNCSKLAKIDVPASVTEIKGNAFFQCTSLIEVILHEGLNTIDYCAFENCTNLEKFNIPSTVLSIGEGAFNSTKLLTEADTDVVYLDNWVIGFKEGLQKANIKEGTRNLVDKAFFSCKTLTELSLPEGITNVPDDMCMDCSDLKSVKLPNSVTSIGDRAFYDCKSLTEITLSKNITEIGSGAFWGSIAVFKCYKDSYAHKYAEENYYEYKLISPPGDANSDGEVSVADVLLIQQYLAKWNVTIDESAADVTGDGKITVADVLLLQQYLAKWNVTLK